MPFIEFNSTAPNFTDPNVTYPVAPFGDGPSIDTSLAPVFRSAYEYEYFTFVLWRLCELSQVAIWSLGYRQMSSHVRPLCFEFLNSRLSAPYGASNPMPDRAPLTPDSLPASLPFQTNQRKEDFLELAAHRPCHRFVDDMDNAYYYNKPLPRLQKETRKIGLGALQLECVWQSILFFASIFSNSELLGKLQPFSNFVEKNSTNSTSTPTPKKAYAAATRLLAAVQKNENITVKSIKEDDFYPNGDCAPGKEKIRLWGFQVIIAEKSNFWFINNQTNALDLYRFCKERLNEGVFRPSRKQKRDLQLLVRYLKNHLFPQTETRCKVEDLLMFTTTTTSCTRSTTTTKLPQRRDLEDLDRPQPTVTPQFNRQHVSTTKTPKHYELYGKSHMRGTTMRSQHNLSQPRSKHRAKNN